MNRTSLINSKFHAIKTSFKYLGQILDQSHMSRKVIFDISFCSHILAFYWNLMSKGYLKAKIMSDCHYFMGYLCCIDCAFPSPITIELSCAVQTVKQDVTLSLFVVWGHAGQWGNKQ